MAISLVLAEDHPITMAGLEALLRQQRDFQVLACCRDGEEALQAVRSYQPDILVLDIRLPGMNGLAVMWAMKAESLPTRVVLLTAGLDEEQVLEAVRLGAADVVLKDTPPQLLIESVRKVHAGEQWLEKHTFGRALKSLVQREAAGREVTGTLTSREIEIVRLVGAGLRNSQIAEKLFISEATVKNHLHHIYEKLQVCSRLELSNYAREKGLI